MVAFEAHSWVRFSVGMIAGCWIGAAFGCAIMMLLTGRRLRQLEAANLLLRVKLRARQKAASKAGSGGGPVLIVPPRANRAASAPLRAAGNR